MTRQVFREQVPERFESAEDAKAWAEYVAWKARDLALWQWFAQEDDTWAKADAAERMRLWQETQARLAAWRQSLYGKGGAARGAQLAQQGQTVRADIERRALALLAEGRSPHALAGIIAARMGKSTKQVRRCLQDLGHVRPRQTRKK